VSPCRGSSPRPWRSLLVGSALVLTVAGGRGRSTLVVLGIALIVLAGAVGIGVDRFAGPVGDRSIAPGPADWPVSTTVAAGTVAVDLTRAPLPATGRLDVHVGAGRVVVRVPDSETLAVTATVVAGTVTVDGETVQEGLDLAWTDPAAPGAHVTVAVDVGTGDVEVHRVRS
jgi:hypothetical protein